jgi:hypothetical protein
MATATDGDSRMFLLALLVDAFAFGLIATKSLSLGFLGIGLMYLVANSMSTQPRGVRSI